MSRFQVHYVDNDELRTWLNDRDAQYEVVAVESWTRTSSRVILRLRGPS